MRRESTSTVSLELKDYPVFLRVGWTAEERVYPQEVLVSLQLSYVARLSDDLASEDITTVIDYAELIGEIDNYSAQLGLDIRAHGYNHVRLLETYGYGLLCHLQVAFTQIHHLKVVLEKPALRSGLCKGGAVRVALVAAGSEPDAKS